nr:putative sulfate exporter family transporter [uncultured Roseococcus sp.]
MTHTIPRFARLLPGLLLCLAITAAAMGLEHLEAALFGRSWLEALVLAILLGTALRTAWTPGETWRPGIAFGAKFLLEVAVVLLGASISVAAMLAVGPALLLGIMLLVAVAVSGGYALCRLLGLTPRAALLVSCGNAICGNSAIAAVAPVIGAEGEEVASSIAFTAVLGVLVVLALPLLVPLLGLSALQFGALAGMTVYAVPQVLAATAPAGALAVQIGTVVKLVRVLMLGPVVLALSLLAPRLGGQAGGASSQAAPKRPPLHRLVPWFILGFLTLMAARSLGLLPPAMLEPTRSVATALTVVSMAALGLGVDIRSVARAGGRVTLAVSLSLLGLAAFGLALILVLGIA